MATTTTTNLMSLDTKPIKSTSLSIRSTNIAQRQTNLYRNTSYDQNTFDRVLDRYSESTSQMSKDTQNVVSDSTQAINDPISATITTSAHGKSKNTQDAPQQTTESSQTTEEVAEVEETEEPSNSNRSVTAMSIFSFASVGVEEQNVAPISNEVQSEVNSNSDLMSILPQSQETSNKAQDMLNLLSGRTWKINNQQSTSAANQPQEQPGQLTERPFVDSNFISLQQNQQMNLSSQVQNQSTVENAAQLLNNSTPVQSAQPVLPDNLNITPSVTMNTLGVSESSVVENPTEISNLMPSSTENLQSANLVQNSLESGSTMNQPQVSQQIQTTVVTPPNTQNAEELLLNAVTDSAAIVSSTEPEETINIIPSQANDNSQQSQQQSQLPLSTQQEPVTTTTLNQGEFDQQLSAQQTVPSQNQSTNAGANLQPQATPQQQQNPVVTQSQINNETPQINTSTNIPTQPQMPLQNVSEQQTVVTEQPQVFTNNEQATVGNAQSISVQAQQDTSVNKETQPQTPTQPQPVTTTLTQNSAEANNVEISVQQTQPQQVTYQPQQVQQQPIQNPQPVQQTQAQPTAQVQVETVEIPQVQATIIESQPEVTNRQPQNQQNFSTLVDVEVDNNNPQPVNPVQQFNQQQQSQSQQQNMQSQAQQATTAESETTNSSENNQQASAENFSAHLGAAINNNNNQTANFSNNPANQLTQTAQTEESITNQIVEHAKMIRNAENTEMVIHLKPEHLGELTLRVSVTSNGSVNASFISENAQVRAMIENTLTQLKNELSNQGLKVDNVQVSAHLSDGGMMNGRGQQAWEQNQRSNDNSRVGRINGANNGNGMTAAEETEIVSASVVNNVVSADGVDYRV